MEKSLKNEKFQKHHSLLVGWLRNPQKVKKIGSFGSKELTFLVNMWTWINKRKPSIDTKQNPISKYIQA